MYPKAFLDYLVQYHCFRDYFECHEVLEEYWKKVGKTNRIWIGFIQLAVSAYHHRRGNFTGAFTLINKAKKIFETEKQQIEALGLNWKKLQSILTVQLLSIKNKERYTSISLPIEDQQLLKECQNRSIQLGVKWNSPNEINDFTINKHKLRNREQVHSRRLEAISIRKKRTD